MTAARGDRSDILRGIRVLVVEDEPETLELVGFLLSRAGADVCAASNAEAALALLERAEMPHVIVSDLHMPGMSGDVFVRRVREEAGDAVRAIALSASASAVDTRRALAAGFDVHVAKPVSEGDLVEAVLALAPPPSLGLARGGEPRAASRS